MQRNAECTYRPLSPSNPVCMCMCVKGGEGGGVHCCGNVGTHITVLHLDFRVHVTLQPDPQ